MTTFLQDGKKKKKFIKMYGVSCWQDRNIGLKSELKKGKS